ncbi:MAG: hypothetical protein KDC78_10650, partial [Aequorivita sp.]|nr:hypothetical protein [Aequorivita sp.]
MKFLILWVSLLLLSPKIVKAQSHISFQHYGVSEGLSNADITTFYQDSQGYMWIGTSNGLNRGNGLHFKIFTVSEDSIENSLLNHKIRSILEDKNNNIWIGTSKGLSKYNPQLEQFTNFTEVGDCTDCLAGRIIKTMVEEGDNLWLGTNAGLSKINTKTYEISSWWYTKESKNIPAIYSVQDILLLKDGNLLLATDEGLVVFNPKQNTFKEITIPYKLRVKGISALFQDSFETIWIGTDYDGV